MAEYLFDNHWAVISTKDTTLNVLCNSYTMNLTEIKTRSPLDLIIVPEQCEANNRFFFLLSHYQRQSKLRLTLVDRALLQG